MNRTDILPSCFWTDTLCDKRLQHICSNVNRYSRTCSVPSFTVLRDRHDVTNYIHQRVSGNYNWNFVWDLTLLFSATFQMLTIFRKSRSKPFRFPTAFRKGYWCLTEKINIPPAVWNVCCEINKIIYFSIHSTRAISSPNIQIEQSNTRLRQRQRQRSETPAYIHLRN